MFRLIGNGACRDEEMSKGTHNEWYKVKNSIGCANICKDEKDCRGYEYSTGRTAGGNCWIFRDWRPVQVCKTAECILSSDSEEYECFVKTTEELYYVLEKKCLAPTKITSFSPTDFYSCLEYCSTTEECLYVNFSDCNCTLMSKCTEWLLPEDDSSGDSVKIAGRLDFHTGHVWSVAENCNFDSDTVAHCTCDEQYWKDCFNNCDEKVDCDAVYMDLDQESEFNSTSNCSNVSLTLSSALLFLKGDITILNETVDSEDSSEMDSITMQTRVVTKLLYAGLIIIIAFCAFHWLARAASHSRQQLYNRWAAAMISVNSANRRSSPVQTIIDPTQIWRYLKQVQAPDWSGSEEQCSICLESFDKVVTQAPCGHIFHRECIQHWLLNTKKECPICRSKVYSSPPPDDSFDDTTDSGASREMHPL